jgi:hypothetical protein
MPTIFLNEQNNCKKGKYAGEYKLTNETGRKEPKRFTSPILKNRYQGPVQNSYHPGREETK